MPLPIATLTSLTATGDLVVGPGDPTFIMNGLPAACICDAVAGPVCEGAIVETESLVILCGLPAATMTSAITGVNPELGFPVETAVAETDAVTDLF